MEKGPPCCPAVTPLQHNKKTAKKTKIEPETVLVGLKKLQKRHGRYTLKY
jgi:hypothetical protein